MGCKCSKHSSPSGESNTENIKIQNGHTTRESCLRTESALKYDERNINIIKRNLEEDPESFVLNNMLMSIHFFENHQKEIMRLQHTTASKMEKDLNKTLLKDETMECTNPDLIFDIVKENVRYRPLHGAKKHVLEPLVARRIYVINDSIEVVNSEDIPQYTHIDKPAFQVRIEESKRHGFVRLKYVGNISFLHSYIEAASKPSENTVEIQQPSTSDSEFYDYTTITEIKTPKPLEVSAKPQRRNTLPETCFSLKEVYAEDYERGDDISKEDLVETITYINSKGFMKYFQNTLFPNSLGRTLGFDEVEVSLAKYIPGKIFCNQIDDDDNIIPCEVIPSVAIEWPTEQTFEFMIRDDRPTITDTRTGIRFRWPTDDMIRDIKMMSCVLVPKGYHQKKGVHADTDIEWEINFPKAERYLEARMSHSQMRCFLILLTIHKTFIEPETTQHGILPEHIRIHMYWECEANYRDWPEHRLATKLFRVIKNLHDRLARSELPHFFIRQKNMFEDIPKKYLRFAQRVFHDILQSPTTFLMRSVRNLRYTTGKFYPPLNFKELYEVLTKKGLALVANTPNGLPIQLRKRKYDDAETQMKHLNELKKREKLFKQRQEEQKQNDPNNDDDERRGSVDSIDLEFAPDKKYDIYKTRAVLQFFIKMYIDIAKASLKLSSISQSGFYLKQASYLVYILEKAAPAFIQEAREFMEIISKEEAALKLETVRRSSSEFPPSTPVRNSISFDFNQQLRNNTVNLHNLHHSYNSTTIQPSLFTKNKTEGNRNLTRKSVVFATDRNSVSDNVT